MSTAEGEGLEPIRFVGADSHEAAQVPFQSELSDVLAFLLLSQIGRPEAVVILIYAGILDMLTHSIETIASIGAHIQLS